MAYGVPGHADVVSPAVLAAWNATITTEFDRQLDAEASGLLLRDPQQIAGGVETDAVHWAGDPAEPRFCQDRGWAEKLSDWGSRGRHVFHNEYFEYGVVHAQDSTGRLRPKRVVATTELAEYWLTAATLDPDLVQSMARDALGWLPAFTDLYGPQGDTPATLTPERRRILFATFVSGHGQHQDLIQAGVPANPLGDLNTRNVLFMSHPINGLDDLIYIVAFGSRAYVVGTGAQRRRATLHEIFRAAGVTHLACRNADPAAAQGAYDQVLKSINGGMGRGCQIAFADPLGMYLGPFNEAEFTYQGQPVPPAWITKRRGEPGREQRFEFGPPDDHPAFLDDIMIEEGAEPTPLTGGYQVARRIEVGPHVVIGPERNFAPQWVTIAANQTPLDCSAAAVCDRVAAARAEYEQEHRGPSPRGIA